MGAESREAVFVALRAKGIKAIKVVAADGSRANGEERGERPVLAASMIGGLCLVLGAVALFFGGHCGFIETVLPGSAGRGGRDGTGGCAPRHQIYGDPAVMEAFERGDFGNALTNAADRMLAWFAQPGRLMCPPDVNPGRLADEFAETYCNVSSDWREVSDTLRQFLPDDLREVRELREIVNGMREELREYLANGNGTPRSYWRRLNERLEEERRIYERARAELEADPSPALRVERNAALRNLGLRTIPAPKKGK